MARRRIYGPTAFLVTLGLVVFFLGLLVLLAIPAAVQLDRKDAEYDLDVKSESRVSSIKEQAMIGLGAGGGLMLLGFALGWRKARRNRSN